MPRPYWIVSGTLHTKGDRYLGDRNYEMSVEIYQSEQPAQWEMEGALTRKWKSRWGDTGAHVANVIITNCHRYN